MLIRLLACRCLPLLLALTACAVRADVNIEIVDTTDEIENNVRAFLSLSRYESRADVTPETMTRLQGRIEPEVRKALEPLGYYNPQVTHEVTRRSDEDWDVVIRVIPGRPVRLSEVNIDVSGAGRRDAAVVQVLERRELKPGLRLNHGRYDRVKGDLLRAAVNQGYLDARFTKNDLAINRDERRAFITLQLDTGDRYYFGDIVTLQDAIDDSAMQRLLRMKKGDPYRLDSLLRTQYVLDDTQYFARTDIEPGDPDRELNTVPITIRSESNRRNRYAVSVGYATDTRQRGRITWDNRIVNRAGHRMHAEAIGSSLLNEASIRYVIPVWDVALEKLEFSLLGREEELGALLSQRVEFTGGLTQVMGKWQRVVFTRLSQERTEPLERVDDPTREADEGLETRDDFLIIPGISFSTLPTYLSNESTRKYTIFSELSGSPSTLGSEASFLRLRLIGERVFDLSEFWHLRIRGDLGATWVDEAFELPASQRFFAGGDRSVRGFGLNELPLPETENDENTGRKHLFTGTVELERDLPRNFRLAAFADVGNAFDNFGDPLEYSAGLGLRYQIAVASLGIDVAQALSVSGRSPRFHLHFTTVF